MKEKPKITFNISIFSAYGGLIEKFAIKAETKADVEKTIRNLIATKGWRNARFKIS